MSADYQEQNSQISVTRFVSHQRRISIKNLILLLSLLLCSCQLVEFEDYVHEPTQKLRQSLIYSGYKEIRGANGRQLVFVPNFRTFTDSFQRNRASLVVVTSLDQDIVVLKAVLHNLDTGASEILALDPESADFKSIEGTDYAFKSLVLIDKDVTHIAKFNTARKLELVITYSIDDNEVDTDVMVIDLITRKDFAWVT